MAFDPIRRLSRSTTLALLLSPAGLLIIAATRLLIVSDYNPVTSLAILSSGGYINTLLGTIVPIAPIVMPYLALALLFFNRAIPGLLAMFAAVLTSPATINMSSTLGIIRNDWHVITGAGAWFHLISVLLAMIFSGLLVAGLVALGFGWLIRTLAAVAAVAIIPVLSQIYPLPISNSFYADLIRQPWMPAERITLASHQNVVGYTLSSDGDWLEVLTADSRAIKYYPARKVVKREICQTERTTRARPLVTLVTARTAIPLCLPPSSALRNPAANWPPPLFIPAGLRPGSGTDRNLLPRHIGHANGG